MTQEPKIQNIKRYHRINQGCTLLFFLFLALTIGLIAHEASHARLVYVDFKNGGKWSKHYLGGARGTNYTMSVMDFKHLYDVEKEDFIKEVDFIYNWSPIIGVQRRYFLDKDKFWESDKIFFYLYDGFLFDECFGLTPDEKPSDVYFYADVVRSSIFYFLLLYLFSGILFEWVKKKYLVEKLTVDLWMEKTILFLFYLYIVY